MFPVVGTGTTRVNPKRDVILGNGKLRVPRGTIVWIGQHALMNCQANWSEPDRFIPERWAQVRMTWEACRHTSWQGDRAHVHRHWQVQQVVAGLRRGSSRKKEKDHLLHTGCLMPPILEGPTAVLGGGHACTWQAGWPKPLGCSADGCQVLCSRMGWTGGAGGTAQPPASTR